MEPWHLSAAVSRATVVAANGTLLIAGGLTAPGTTTGAVVRVDPSNGTQAKIGALAQPTHDAGGALFGNTLFVFGGGVSSTVRTVQSFTGSTSAKAASLPEPRSDLSVARAGTQAIILGGYDGTTLLRSVLATSDGIHFTQIANLPHPVRYAAVAGVGSVVYVFGGTTGTADTVFIQSIDVSTGRAAVVGRMPSSLSHATAVALGGTILIMGGRSNHGRVSKTVYRFDPATGRVRQAAALPVAISDAGGAVIGARAYLVGGEDSQPRATVMACSIG
ncbi:MAG: Kelch repeat-containing protein [Actinomycetota bacterium]